MGFVKPFPLPLTPYLRSGYLLRGRTLAELARKAGIDETEFVATVERYNGPVREGQDPEFGRGTTAYNRYLGDAQHKPNPCLKPLEEPPFYAIQVVPGDLGTSPASRRTAMPACSTARARRSPAFMRQAMTTPRSWAAIIRGAA